MRRTSMVIVSCVVVLLVVMASLGSGPATVYASDVSSHSADRGEVEPEFLPAVGLAFATGAAAAAGAVVGKWVAEKVIGIFQPEAEAILVPAAALD